MVILCSNFVWHQKLAAIIIFYQNLQISLFHIFSYPGYLPKHSLASFSRNPPLTEIPTAVKSLFQIALNNAPVPTPLLTHLSYVLSSIFSYSFQPYPIIPGFSFQSAFSSLLNFSQSPPQYLHPNVVIPHPLQPIFRI